MVDDRARHRSHLCVHAILPGDLTRSEKRQSVKSEGIAYERNYGVEYTDRGENGSAESVMQMVEIQGGDGMRRRSVA